MKDTMRNHLGVPAVVDRSTFQAELDALRVREKAHTREGDAMAAARRRLPMVEVDGATPLIGESGAVTLLDAFEGRGLLIAYYFMWHPGHPAPEQCEGCTFFTSQVCELSPPACPRRHLRHVLPGPVRRKRSVPRVHGLGDALVLGPGFARHALGWAPDRHDAPRLLSATGIRCLRDLLDDDARRRGDGQQLPVARLDRLRAAGAVGALADRLAATVGRGAAYADRWASHLPMVTPEGRTFRRSGHWPPLTSFQRGVTPVAGKSFRRLIPQGRGVRNAR